MNQISASLFGSDFRYLERVVQTREQLNTIHSTNIANADTPNFRADARGFDELLAEHKRGGGAAQLAATQPGHIGSVPHHGDSLMLGSERQESGRLDGNTVDIQQEMTSLAENQMLHDLSVRLLQGKIHGLLNAIKEGGR